MIVRKIMGRASQLVLGFLAMGFFFGTHNILTMMMHNEAADSGGRPNGLEPLDVYDQITNESKEKQQLRNAGSRFHVAVTATITPYSQWQCRIMYYYYKKVRSLPGSDMGAFTRVLHSGTPDNLMEEIPSFVVDPLPDGLDRGYIVLHRPWAFIQWLEAATIDEEYILMAEPDHIFLRPLPNLAQGDSPAAYPFSYITPKEHEKIIRKFYPVESGPVTNIAPIGNSPVIIKRPLLEKIAPTWLNLSLNMKHDKETDEAFGWVLEMYAYAVAAALHGVNHILHKEFMIQPPWDVEVGETFILHYTYALDYTLKGELTFGKIGEWSFDKRLYLDGPPPKNLTLPPPGFPESVVMLLKKINEATANIPRWGKEKVEADTRT